MYDASADGQRLLRALSLISTSEIALIDNLKKAFLMVTMEEIQIVMC